MASSSGPSEKTTCRRGPPWVLLLAFALLFQQFILHAHHHGIPEAGLASAALFPDRGDDGDCAICHDLALASVTLLRPDPDADTPAIFVDVQFTVPAALSRRQLAGYAHAPRGPPLPSA